MGNCLLPPKAIKVLGLPQLPEELLEHIFGYCDLLSIKCLACCSHAHAETCRFLLWRSVTLPPLELVKKNLSKDYRSKFFHYITDLFALAELDPTLKYITPFLDGKQCRNVDNNLDFVFTLCSNLNKLYVSRLMRFDKLENLMELTLTGRAASDEILAECCKWLLRLKSLHIEDERKGVTKHGVKVISGLEKLESLTVNILYDGFLPICEDGLPPKLHELVIAGCYFLDIPSARYEKLTSLTKLRIQKGKNVEYNTTQNYDFHYISSAIFLKDLTILKLGDNLLRYNTAYNWLKDLVNLCVLRLDCDCYFSDEALQTIGDNLIKLVKLVLSFGSCYALTDNALIHLTKLQHLVVVEFSTLIGIGDNSLTLAGFTSFHFMMVSAEGTLGVVEHEQSSSGRLISLTWKHIAGEGQKGHPHPSTSVRKRPWKTWK